MRANSVFTAPVSEYYVAQKDFSVTINGTMHSFKINDAITKPYMVEAMLRGGCPITKATSAGDFCTCPKCGYNFIAE